MGQGVQEAGMIARGTRSGVEMMMRIEDILAAMLTSRNTKEAELFADYIKDENGTINYDITIPRAKIAEFVTEMDRKNVPFMIIDPSKGAIGGSQNFKFEVDGMTYHGSEYVGIMYRGPIYQFDLDGNVMLNAEGQRVAKAGTDLDAAMIHATASKLSAEYLAEMGRESKELAHQLNATEANHKFVDSKTIKIETDSLGKLYMMQRHANELGIDSYISKLGNDKYQLEVNAIDAVRLNANTPSPVERLVFDSKFAFSEQRINGYLTIQDKDRETVLEAINDNRVAKPNNMVIIDLDSGELDRNHLPKRFELENGIATLYEGTEKVESFDLQDPSSFSMFETKYQEFQHVHPVTKDEFTAALTNEDAFEGLKFMTGIKQKAVNEYESIRTTVFNASQQLIDQNMQLYTEISPTLKDDPHNPGHQMVEMRLEDSDKIVCDMIAKNSNGRVDADQMLQSLKDHENRELSFAVTTPSQYVPVAQSARLLQLDASERDHVVVELEAGHAFESTRDVQAYKLAREAENDPELAALDEEIAAQNRAIEELGLEQYAQAYENGDLDNIPDSTEYGFPQDDLWPDTGDMEPDSDDGMEHSI